MHSINILNIPEQIKQIDHFICILNLSTVMYDNIKKTTVSGPSLPPSVFGSFKIQVEEVWSTSIHSHLYAPTCLCNFPNSLHHCDPCTLQFKPDNFKMVRFGSQSAVNIQYTCRIQNHKNSLFQIFTEM